MSKSDRLRTIKVEYLARVEGEGGLFIRIKGASVAEVKLHIFEPPRFFEAFMRGRRFDEAPDITARICGICPVAYQMSAAHAMEAACGVALPAQLRALRRLMYCGEWIESHALHVFLLHAPDFLGYQDAIQMAGRHRDLVQCGLRLKKLGNRLVALLGGREIHPVNVRVGGFYRVPAKAELQQIAGELERAQHEAVMATRALAKLKFPDFEQDYEFVALRHPDEYPLTEGRLVSNKGLDIPIEAFFDHFAEEQVPYSTALHCVRKGRGNYLVGPLARFNLNFDRLSRGAQKLAQDIGLVPPVRNPFKSILARMIELVYAFEEALKLISEYEPPAAPCVPVSPRAGLGHGCTEAPRGILYHRYRIDEHGIIEDAKIVPPTAQNQRTIENDLRAFVAARLRLTDEKLTWLCEQAVRNYDPCISCSTHALRVRITRE
ncbi:MAG: Ni/Fe hydrogenase subunit alpha [Verrucomicrobiae bacterium]|nr:Ni/Fe hydrogenase subunit alpha [Verrucomicrobiae bacterium]MCX7721882.1 Ni/Fe hydrogenase subunit alpha [Verrucomicrobiae bacterium]MDW7980303.1 Ni/Fe hydrogenase subunit alpha [Verrucomicrobiales bacterium]